MIVTNRDREIAESAWDAAADMLRNERNLRKVSGHLYEANPWRAEGTRYCANCGEATYKHSTLRLICGTCGQDY